MLNKAKSTVYEKMSRCSKDCCYDYAKRRLPILSWARDYKFSWLAQDALAGFTVGLTAVPQGIAYGIVAELSPEYGLYASFMASFVYIIFGSCKSITIGPTAIMATMVRPLVLEYGADMAILLTFLKGCIIALLGLFHLGFLLDFISLPVITGFTAAASINIATSQFKPLLGIAGRSEDLVDSLVSVFSNLNSIRYQDTLLGIATIVVLVLFKNLPGRRTGTWPQRIAWAGILARNALVVIVGTLIAYIFFINDKEPFKLTGTMGNGLPPFGPPSFSITANNRTYDFLEATAAMGTTLFSIPIVSTIEHMAIAKAFGIYELLAKGTFLDGTQEMLALGLCNIFGSFARSMPVTGSFTRTAVNYSSGVKTTFGGLFTGCLVLLASSLLTTTFRFIPKATLAGVIICSMYYMLDFKTYALLWRAKIRMGNHDRYRVKSSSITVFLGSTVDSKQNRTGKVGDRNVIRVIPEESITFPAAEHFRASVMKLSEGNSLDVILDCKNLKRTDVTVAKNLKLLANDLELQGTTIIYENCQDDIEHVLKTFVPSH
ncbi:hypothetical protein E2986_04170 [Frieseomelitta varia]|uniref:Sodium-independent sulfate anion transporter n=1 Tax=Frieseomelitta varia TaxID=561572 RepID=A0A833VYX9_9HYME|nr:hypothetical protein E2986_04170 [Frieseomelitta varia]